MEQFTQTLKDAAPEFITSMVELVTADKALQACDPREIIMEALKAAVLHLPLNKQLGYAWIVPYKNVPQFQLGYKGLVQLAMRSGQYEYINAGVIYEGEEVIADRLTGAIEIKGIRTSENAIGYFAHFTTLNGTKKTVWSTRDEMRAHAEKYSKSYSYSSSPWKTEFDKMATKTMIRSLLSKWGILTVSMEYALKAESAPNPYEEAQARVEERANQGPLIDVTDGPDGTPNPPPIAGFTKGPQGNGDGTVIEAEDPGY
jgi:recombination protein RecT